MTWSVLSAVEDIHEAFFGGPMDQTDPAGEVLDDRTIETLRVLYGKAEAARLAHAYAELTGARPASPWIVQDPDQA
jgi:hypothetical protein